MKKIQAARKRAGLSQTELAKKSGINKRMLQHYEQKRDVDRCNLYRLIPLAMAMGCEIQDIVEDENLVKMLDDYIDKVH